MATSNDFSKKKLLDFFIQKIKESNTLPWNNPYLFNKVLPQNFITRNPYRGMNLLLLWVMGHKLPYYLTFKQVTKLKGKVKKGAKGIPVYFISKMYKLGNKTIKPEAFKTLSENQKANVYSFSFLKVYYVFNIEDTEGIDYSEVLPKESDSNTNVEKNQACETIVSNYKDKPEIVNKDNSVAYYSPLQDIVNMPEQKYMKTNEAYYSTLFHELVHSTLHETRLNRKDFGGMSKGNKEVYSKEELVAEIGAAMLCNIAGIANEQTNENSAAYLKNWLSKIENDTNLIFTAATHAQKAVDYIQGLVKQPKKQTA